MFKRTIFTFVVAVFLTGLMAACSRTALIYDLEDHAIGSFPDQKLTLEKIKDAIIKGVKSKGWRIVKVEGENTLVANFRKGSRHFAQVEIKYTKDNYSITYKDSTGLMQRGNRIHKNYNRWVSNLRVAIDVAIDDEFF